MEFRILGPLEVVEDGRPLRLGHGRERSLLAILLLRANETVSSDTLIDELWHGEPPATAQKALQVYVSRLRKRLGEHVISTRAPGYAIAVDPDDLDAARFEQLVAEARGADPAVAASKLRDALSLWRGPALAELVDEPFARPEIARLEESRLAALEDRFDADLALGHHAAIVGELELQVSRNPYRERMRAQLMLALYRSGRQADALASYRDARRALTDELGLEPGPELRELERRILAQDGDLDLPAGVEHAGTGPRPESGDPRSPRRRRLPLALAALAALALAAVVVAVAGFAGRSSPRPVVAKPSSVAVIDPATNRVVAAIPVGDRPTQIALYGDAVWVLHPDIRTLSLLSRSERRVLRTVGVSEAPSSLAVDEHGVWVTDALAAAVTLIEPERFAVVKTVRTGPRPMHRPGYVDAGHIAVGFGSLWFASGERTITRIDAATGRVVTRIRGVDTGESLGGIAVGDDSVWVAGPYQTSMVTRIDPRRNAVVARIHVQKYRLNGIAVGPDAVWVSDVGSDQVWAIDPVLNKPVGTTAVGGQPLGVSYGAGAVWVANSGDGTVSRIDPTSRRVLETIAVGGSPNGIVATDDGVWVTVD